MTTRTKTLEPGAVAYDLAQHEPVIIIDPDVGTVAEQSPAMEERVRVSAGNQACGVDPETQCVEVMFCNLDGVNDGTYTFPETRLGTPQMRILDEKLTTNQFVQYQTLKELMAEAARHDSPAGKILSSLWQNSSLNDAILAAVEEAVDSESDA